MKNFKLLFFLLLVLISCQKDEEVIRAFPRLLTLEVSDINSNGALFTAEIISPGSSPINEYGFVWGTRKDPTIEYSEIMSTKEQPISNHFPMTVEHSLQEGETYFVKSFAKNEDYITYGNVTSFVSLGSKAPVITDFEPKTGAVGDTIFITGQYFTKNKYNLQLAFNDHNALILSCTDSTIKTKVPQLTEIENQIKINVFNKQALANDNFRLKTPEIHSFSPQEGVIGEIITIKGNNLLVEHIEDKILLGSMHAEVQMVSDTEIKVKAPKVSLSLPHPSLSNEEILRHKIKIQDDIEVIESTGYFTYLFPEIHAIDPTEGSPGDTLTISGDKFTSLGYDQKLYFGPFELEPIYIDENQIKLIIPENAGVTTTAFISLKIEDVTILSNELYHINNPNNGGNQVLLPGEATFGDIVLLYLEDIDGSTNDISVALTDVDAEIIEIGIGYIKFKIPDDNLYVEEMITIRIGSNYQTIMGLLSIRQPVISAVIPSEVSYGETVALVGYGFSPSTNYCNVNVQGEIVPVIEASYNQISFIFPSGVQEIDGKISIQYHANELQSNIFSEVSLK